MPGGDAPGRRRSQHGVVIEAPELRPDDEGFPLPEVGVQRHRDEEGEGEGEKERWDHFA